MPHVLGQTGLTIVSVAALAAAIVDHPIDTTAIFANSPI